MALLLLILASALLQCQAMNESPSVINPSGIDRTIVRELSFLTSESDNDTQIVLSTTEVLPSASKIKISQATVIPIDPGFNCGYRNVNGVGFKPPSSESNETNFGEFPWMVGIFLNNTTDGGVKFYCGGSLITPTTVLTAAHCVRGEAINSIQVRAGEWNTTSRSELYPHQDRPVAEYVIHENYKKVYLHNDIALLFLDMPFELAPNVIPICLAPSNTSFDNSSCYATGWGMQSVGYEDKPDYSPVLKKMEMPMVPKDVCQERLRRTRLRTRFELHESFICAGGEPDKDMCRGDGGSPLVCPIAGSTNRFYQAGIVSWGIGCGSLEVPGVYVDVTRFRTWIDEQLVKRKADSSFYKA